jgi:hypothetical protein
MPDIPDPSVNEPGPAPIPPDNQPGHHPDVEQDKPEGPPPTPGWRGTKRFDFEFDKGVGVTSRLVGVSPATAGVEVGDGELTIRFGRWTLSTPLANVASTTVTGPYAWWKVAGTPRLSLADRGVTFATTTARGLCIEFADPVPALLPTSLLRHPGATVTVADPEGLAEAIEVARAT